MGRRKRKPALPRERSPYFKKYDLPSEHVYVVHKPDYGSKIGVTTDLLGRLRRLRAEHGKDLVMVYSKDCLHYGRRVEGRAHGRLQSQRIKGEWFAVSSEEAKHAVNLAYIDFVLDDTPYLIDSRVLPPIDIGLTSHKQPKMPLVAPLGRSTDHKTA